MKINKNDLKEKIKKKLKKFFLKVVKHKNLRNLWVFGLILTGFCLFIDLKLLMVILFIMIFLTIATSNNIEIEETGKLDELLYEQENIENILEVMKEHIETGNATLDEKIEYKQATRELEEINKLIEEIRK